MLYWQDWSVLALYMLVVVVIGVLSARQKNLADFLFASGSLPWWAVGVSLIATSVSSTSFLGSPAEAYAHGFALLMLNLPVPFSLFLVWVLFIPWFRKNRVNSAYELLGVRFGRMSQLLASGIYSFHLLLRAGVLIYGPALVLSRFLGVSIYVSLLLVAVVAMVYSYAGGLRAVVWTDVLQFAALAAGAVAIAIRVSSLYDGGASGLLDFAFESGRFHVFDFSFDLSSPRTFISAAVAYFVFDLAIRASDQQFIQRYMSCRSVAEAQFSALLSVLLGFVLSLGFFLLGAMLWSFCQTGGTCPANPNEVLPFFVGRYLAGGAAGLVLAGVFAAAMSSLDSAISSLTNTAIVDILPYFGSKQVGMLDEDISFARTLTLVFGVVALGISFYVAGSKHSLLEIALSLSAIFPGVLFSLIAAARAGLNLKDAEAFGSALLGLISIAVVKFVFGGFLAWTWWPLLSFVVGFGVMSIFHAIRTFGIKAQ